MKILIAILSLGLSLPTSAADIKRLVIIGDSITEGFGVAREAAYPGLLQKKIAKSGKSWMVVNSGISGSTSASAVSRVQWHLKQKPALIVIALGANDGLRGTSTEAMETNLNKAVEACKAAKVKVIVAGIQVPPNYGASYAGKFAAVFGSVAKKNDIPLIPFLLEKVAGDASLNLPDGIHPNEKGHAIIAETVYKALQKYL